MIRIAPVTKQNLTIITFIFLFFDGFIVQVCAFFLFLHALITKPILKLRHAFQAQTFKMNDVEITLIAHNQRRLLSF